MIFLFNNKCDTVKGKEGIKGRPNLPSVIGEKEHIRNAILISLSYCRVSSKPSEHRLSPRGLQRP